MEREKLKSRLGFILLSAGCAIGIGNVWKFPYMAGQGGGGAFVLFYLLFLVILGLPIHEHGVCRGPRQPQESGARLSGTGKAGPEMAHPRLLSPSLAAILLMMFYTTVAGWMMHYFYHDRRRHALPAWTAAAVAGAFADDAGQAPASWRSGWSWWSCSAFFVCVRGLQNGLERVTKAMMIALLVIMVILAVNSLFMPGGS